MLFSFVVPTYNEEKNICHTLKIIKKHVPCSYDYEVIIVDHGSTDCTADLARKNGAKVYIHPEGTIGGLRNYGVKKSNGKILVFLDADVLLTAEWENRIGDVVRSLCEGKRILTGSWVSVLEDAKWIEEYWFKPLQKGENTHINSGHLIVSRELFDEISGFNDRLETGEDYDISMRAKAAGIQVIDDLKLKVIHEGFPKNLKDFIKREYWHGKGDADSVLTFITSKVAILAFIFIIIHIALITAILASETSWILALTSSIVIIVLGSSFFKYRKEPLKTVWVNSFLYYCYFWARGISLLSFAGMRKINKRAR